MMQLYKVDLRSDNGSRSPVSWNVGAESAAQAVVKATERYAQVNNGTLSEVTRLTHEGVLVL